MKYVTIVKIWQFNGSRPFACLPWETASVWSGTKCNLQRRRRHAFSCIPQRNLFTPRQCHTAASAEKPARATKGWVLVFDSEHVHFLFSPLAASIYSIGDLMWVTESSLLLNFASNADPLNSWRLDSQLTPGFRLLIVSTSDWSHTSKYAVLRHYFSIFLYATQENFNSWLRVYFGNVNSTHRTYGNVFTCL